MSGASPYRGLEPFLDTDEDARRFFARDRERGVLIANLEASRLTVLHGESGVGKSSLLRAGVAHQLRSAGQATVVVFAAWHDDPLARLADAVDDAVAGSVGHPVERGLSALSLAHRLEAAALTLGDPLYVVLDQFEEALLYHAADPTLMRELGDALSARGEGPSFLVAMRDDALGQLDVMRPFAPGILANTLRLEHLDRGQAEHAVRGPLALVNADRPEGELVSIEDGLVAAVLDQVAVGQVELGQARGTAGAASDGGVEAPYLQLVLERLWSEEQEVGSSELRLETLDRLGGAETIVRQHVDGALGTLSAADQDVAARIFDHLVTPAGAKVALTTADLAGYGRVAEHALEPTLEALAQQRLLRPVAAAGSRRWEIFHDVLAPSILGWTSEHERRVAVEHERREARRRQRRLVAVLAALAALCAFAIVEWRRADSAGTSARAQALVASARASLPIDPQASVAIGAQAVRVRPDESSVEVLREALAKANERMSVTEAAPIVAADASPDGRSLVLVARTGRARVVRASDGRTVRLLGPRDGVRAAAWSPDGTRIVTVARTGAAELSDARSGRLVRRLPGAGVRLVGFAARAPLLFTASNDELRLLDADTGSLERVLRPPGGVQLASISPDGSQITVIDSAGEPHVLATASGREPFRLARDVALSVAYSADGSRLATRSQHAARVYDSTTGRLLLRVPVGSHDTAPDVTAVALSPDDSALVVGTSDGGVQVWDVARRRLANVLSGHQGVITSADYSPDGRWIVTGSDDHSARVWRADNGAPPTLLAGSPDSVSSARFVRGARMVLTVGQDGAARVWDAQTVNRLVPVMPLGGSVRSGVPVPGGNDALLAGPGHVGMVIDTARRRIVRRLTEHDPVIAVAAGGGLLATATTRHVTLWTSQGQPSRTIEPGAVITSVALDANGRVAIGTARDGVFLYDRNGHALQHLAGFRSAVLSVAFSPDGRRLVAGLGKGTAWIWDTSDGRNLAILQGHLAAVLGVRFSADGRSVATASRDHNARLWDPASGRTIHILQLHSGMVSDAEFSPDDEWIVTAGPGTAGLFPASTGIWLRAVYGPSPPLHSAWFSPDGRTVFALGSDPWLHAYTCVICQDAAHLLALADARLAPIR